MNVHCADPLSWLNQFLTGPTLKAKPVVSRIPPATIKRCKQCRRKRPVKYFLIEDYDQNDKPLRSEICQVCAVKLKKEKSRGLQSKDTPA